MTGIQTVAVIVVSMATGQGAVYGTSYLAGRRAEIARSWVDGREWLTARRTAAARVDARRVMRRLAVWALARLFRPHGQHRRRAGVGSC